MQVKCPFCPYPRPNLHDVVPVACFCYRSNLTSFWLKFFLPDRSQLWPVTYPPFPLSICDHDHPFKAPNSIFSVKVLLIDNYPLSIQFPQVTIKSYHFDGHWREAVQHYIQLVQPLWLTLTYVFLHAFAKDLSLLLSLLSCLQSFFGEKAEVVLDIHLGICLKFWQDQMLFLTAIISIWELWSLENLWLKVLRFSITVTFLQLIR